MSHAVNGDGSRFGSGRDGQDTFVASPLKAGGNLRHDASHDTYIPVAGTLCSTHTPNGHGARGPSDQEAASGLLVPVSFDTTQITSPGNYSNPKPGDACHPLASGAHAPAVAFQTRIARNGRGQPKDITDALTSADGGTHADSKSHVAGAFGVRRLTPTECERLQGFPDDWTRYGHDGKELADSPRYRMLGNAVAVPIAEWIGRRLMEGGAPRMTRNTIIVGDVRTLLTETER